VAQSGQCTGAGGRRKQWFWENTMSVKRTKARGRKILEKRWKATKKPADEGGTKEETHGPGLQSKTSWGVLGGEEGKQSHIFSMERKLPMFEKKEEKVLGREKPEVCRESVREPKKEKWKGAGT